MPRDQASTYGAAACLDQFANQCTVIPGAARNLDEPESFGAFEIPRCARDDECRGTAKGTTISNPLSILHLLLASDAGGLSKYVIDLGCAMRDLGHSITIAGDRGIAQPLFDQVKLDYIQIPLKGGPLAFLKSATRMRKFLRDHPIDVIHTHYRRATLLARRLQARARMRPPVVLPGTEDSIVPLDSSPFPPILYTLHLSHIAIGGPRRWLTDFGDHTHVASEDARRWLIDEARVPANSITLIHHGIDLDRFPVGDDITRRAARIALGLDPNALVASYVGRFEDPKNESWLLDLAGATRGQMPELHLLLVGGGPNEPALRHRVDAENLHDRVHLFGYREPLPIYQASDLLLLPSAREGFSLVCAEAMAVGVPVLRTRTSGTAELIREDITGRSVPIDHDAFIDAAITMLQDREALSRMGLAAARHVRDNFTFDRQVTQTIDLYRRLTPRRRNSEPA